jgi:predicted aldo/keto reductase-like oxidoreductase
MQTTTLPHTDLRVSRACVGTMTFGSQTDEATATRIVDLCVDRGINFLDTANVYNLGKAEMIADPEQFEQNLNVLDRGALSEECIAACNAVWHNLRGKAPKYNR